MRLLYNHLRQIHLVAIDLGVIALGRRSSLNHDKETLEAILETMTGLLERSEEVGNREDAAHTVRSLRETAHDCSDESVSASLKAMASRIAECAHLDQPEKAEAPAGTHAH